MGAAGAGRRAGWDPGPQSGPFPLLDPKGSLAL